MQIEKLEKVRKCLLVQQLLLRTLINIKKLKLLKKKIILRRWWVKPHLYPDVRNLVGAYELLFNYFKLRNGEEFYEFTRMSVQNFYDLIYLVSERLQKQVCRRPPIPPEIRLAITLHYLGHGGSVSSEAMYFRVGKSTMYDIIAETCNIIQTTLLNIYVKPPDEAEWLQIAQDFEEKWNFPNCIGALDGKHIEINRPAHGGSLFHNYKNFESVNLMAVSDAHSRFIWFSVGDCGSFNDASVFAATDFSRKLFNNELNIPNSRCLINTNIRMPFTLVGDEIFPLGHHLMKPFSRRCINSVTQRIFNYRLSRARFTIECAFGILCAKWRVLNRALNFKLKTTNNIVAACICLHNYIITRNRPHLNNMHNANNRRREDDDYAQQIQGLPRDAPAIIRNRFAEYFVSDVGSIPWQYQYI
ncbi:uncharacterized protein LOC116415772 [Nasonia vitripennis]|uniref:DDE Tnp4 domain-containing protein n=1 Tax=Nasonia vitripennis TaxID=7425 RepID=A0A7M7PUT9_NASVI|nr:uncharacterized protein LOC116415772 [Nasonia vitripennis]